MEILKNGFNTTRVYVTPNYNMALNYGEAIVIISIDSDEFIDIDRESCDFVDISISDAIEKNLSLKIFGEGISQISIID